MSSRSRGSRSQMVLQEYNFAGVINLTALAVLAEFVSRVQTAQAHKRTPPGECCFSLDSGSCTQ
jgi:hypothetical protein